MMQQYDDAKALCGDAVLLFRMGDFYELFHDDAKIAAKLLGLTLTSRDKGENPIPMAGFPHHQLDQYLAKLITSGVRAAVCEQVEDPKMAKGLVRREVTRVVSAGTVTDDALLDPKSNNYIAAVAYSGKVKKGEVPQVGIAWAEMSTGRFYSASFPESKLVDQLARIQPTECVVAEDSPPLPKWTLERVMISKRPAWEFGMQEAEGVLERHFEVRGMEGFGFLESEGIAIRAAGGLLKYLQETQRSALRHFDRLSPYRVGTTLELDESTRRSLELTRTIREGGREGSLLAVLDRCVTPMGSRLLSDWLANPLTNKSQIDARLDAVAEFASDPSWCADIRKSLDDVYDIERLLARVVTGRATPRDLSFVGRTLSQIPRVRNGLHNRVAQLLNEMELGLDPCQELQDYLAAALENECPLLAKEGGFIRAGFNEELDRLRELTAGGKQWIVNYQARIVQETGIPSLKVGFNSVFGYYIEITNTHSTKVPDNFIRKQTLKNAERYITPELKEYEEQVLTADERAKSLEYDLFVQLRDLVQNHAVKLQRNAAILAQLDVLVGLADLAVKRNYSRPTICEEPTLQIIDGRHPVLDILEPDGTFVPNDTELGAEQGSFMLITGPNMAGKSTYIRQVALLTILAQIGSFVPARKARLGIADRIFARVGASDELSRGQSTFMVEMTETARILNTATERSLVILDEIGRGTSTYDGVSLAWAIVEYIHDQIGCRTLFATHYHELTDLKQSLDGIRNFNVAVKEWADNVVFLHKIVPGAADKSYGIHVARLAGVPKEVNERAKDVLSQLESQHLDGNGRPKIASKIQHRKRNEIQLTLFGPANHPILDRIREVSIDSLPPLEALRLVHEWQAELRREDEKQPGFRVS